MTSATTKATSTSPPPSSGGGGGASSTQANALRTSARIASGARGGGSSSAGLAKDVAGHRAAPALSSADASLYADLEVEERGRRMCALIRRSPQILQILRRGPGTENRQRL